MDVNNWQQFFCMVIDKNNELDKFDKSYKIIIV